MPIPTPPLDTVTFQQLVDHAKRLIPRYCPEWTDHNVSDPGVTLIELFASMVEMLTYRVNQVPDRMYVAFLNFIGAQLEPPQPACAPITVYLSKRVDPGEVFTIPAGTRITTVRTETQPPIPFATRTPLDIWPLRLVGAYRVPDGADLPRVTIPLPLEAWRPIDLDRLSRGAVEIPIFADVPPPENGSPWPAPAVGDALYLAFDPEANASDHVLVLDCGCVAAGGGGSSELRPPIEWQLWDQASLSWRPCGLDRDETGGFNRNGRITLRLPAAEPGPKGGHPSAFWLRCRLTAAQAPEPADQARSGDGASRYAVMPRLTWLKAETWGGTILAWQEQLVENELLGESDGTPGQTFRLRHAPILARAPGERLTVWLGANSHPEPWEERRDFGASNRDSSHYTLDPFDGTLTLGPLLRQPDGAVLQLGMVPPRGSRLVFTSYRFGGGQAGNVGPHQLTVIKESLAGVQRVTNHQAARGGVDGQTIDDLRRVPPAVLGLHTRAVTADDYTRLAAAFPGIARTRCLAPGRSPAADAPAGVRPGRVVLLAAPLPDAVPLDRPLAMADLELPPGDPRLLAVWHDLNARAPLGCELDVRPPAYLWVRVDATLVVAPKFSPQLVAAAAAACLYAYLNPFTGGPEGRGWPFDRTLPYWELQNLLRSITGLHDARVQLFVTRRRGDDIFPEPHPQASITLRPDELLCSATHSISVE
jgi:predicted phage baseplate assembly protein